MVGEGLEGVLGSSSFLVKSNEDGFVIGEWMCQVPYGMVKDTTGNTELLITRVY